MLFFKNTLISDAITEEHFVCDLNSCRGECCADGDTGAPLDETELPILQEIYEYIRPFLSEEGSSVLKEKGLYVADHHFKYVTPSLHSGLCAYGKRNEQGIIHCAIEQAHTQGLISWAKPISCHLFPILASRSKHDPDLEFLNYQPRKDLCAQAMSCGKQLKVPVFLFLKDALARKYGQEIHAFLESHIASPHPIDRS